jgi:hypothetical protein
VSENRTAEKSDLREEVHLLHKDQRNAQEKMYRLARRQEGLDGQGEGRKNIADRMGKLTEIVENLEEEEEEEED